MVVEVGQAPWRPVFDVLIGSFSDQMLTLGDPIDHSNRNLILSVMAAFTTLKMRSIAPGRNSKDQNLINQEGFQLHCKRRKRRLLIDCLCLIVNNNVRFEVGVLARCLHLFVYAHLFED